MTFLARWLDRVHDRLIASRRTRALARHAADLLPPEARVLDVGCGDGELARSVMDLRPDVTITGLEVLERATCAIPLELFEGVAIPREDDTVDAVLMVNVLHHTDDPEVLLGEAARVARRAVVLKDHLLEGFLAGPQLRLMDWGSNAPHGVRLPYIYWTVEQWTNAFRRLGLDVVEWREDLDQYAWPLSLLLGRRLHFMARLEPGSRA
jgi:SAM-dependent methyltransferase